MSGLDEIYNNKKGEDAIGGKTDSPFPAGKGANWMDAWSL
jgi:hypothetical protein